MFAIEKIIELVSSSWKQLIFWYVLPEYESGVVMRLGKCNREAESGIHFKIPIVEGIVSTESVNQPKEQDCQTCSTSDGVTVSFQTLTFFSIVDAKTFLIDNDETREILSGLVMTVAADIVVNNDFKFFVSPKFRRLLKTRVNRQQHRLGVRVTRIGMMEQFRFDRTYLTKG